MKKSVRNKSIIVIMILIVSLLHFFGGPKDLPMHGFYRLLYFIPIIFAAFNFGFRGGIVSSLVVSLIYSPFILLTLGSFSTQAISEFLDIILFFSVGAVTGTLVEKKNLSLAKLNDELKRHMMLESYTNSIIQSIKSGVIAVNNDMLITITNQGAQTIMSLSDDCIGQNFTEIFACCESVNDKIYQAFKNNTAVENIELSLVKKEMAIRICIYPLNFEEIRKGFVIIIEDITEIKKLQKELLRSEKLAALGELSTGVAHEIRNPLGIIKAIEQTMKKELKGNPEAVKELDMIDEEVERANKVIKALMEFGRPASGERKLYSINVVIEDVLTVANNYIIQHGVKALFSKEEVDTLVIIDKELIKQAFINIIFNAVQAMPNGGTLTITTSTINGIFVNVKFKDTGVGIKHEDIEKIFNPFYTTKEEGTGLGLSIVHRIIEEYGGTINVSSQEGKGTAFEIMLPLRRI